jgi:hypothetical protein
VISIILGQKVFVNLFYTQVTSIFNFSLGGLGNEKKSVWIFSYLSLEKLTSDHRGWVPLAIFGAIEEGLGQI